MIVWDAIGYTFQSPLVHIECTLNNGSYISIALKLLALPFIRALRKAMFQQDNALSHVVDFVQIFLDTENIRLLPLSARFPDLLQI